MYLRTPLYHNQLHKDTKYSGNSVDGNQDDPDDDNRFVVVDGGGILDSVVNIKQSVYNSS